MSELSKEREAELRKCGSERIGLSTPEAIRDLLTALDAARKERDEWKESFRIATADENDMCDRLNRVLDKRGGYTEEGGDTYAANFERIIAALESRLAAAEGSLDMIANGRVTNTDSADAVIRELRRIASAALTRVAAWREGKSWQQIVGEWADATFPASSQETIIAHLRAEVNEEIGVDCDPSELADVGLLLLHLAHKRGVSLDAIMRSKHEVNKRRTWQSMPNDRGFMSHTKEADHAV